MKRSAIVVTISVLLVISILVGLSCAPQTRLDITVAELDNGVMIQNVRDVDCLVFVNSPEGQQ
jgi:hypothetical protein